MRILYGISLTRLGKAEEARNILEEATAAAKKERIPPYFPLAILCLTAGNKDQGFAYLDRSYER
jgi:hypothetical protein